MPQSWVELLLDREAICQQLKAAKEQEPSRYEAATDEWAYQATLNLNTYLKSCRNPPQRTLGAYQRGTSALLFCSDPDALPCFASWNSPRK